MLRHYQLASFTQRHVRSRFRDLLATLAIAVLFGSIPAAAAGVCSARADRAVAAMERQVAAIRQAEQQRKCSARRLFGIFSGCRDLAQRRQALVAQLEASGTPRCIRQAAVPKASAKLTREPARRASRRSAGAALYCVRLSDGYYFPAPQSQYASREHLGDAAEQCRFICNTQEVELYQLPDFRMETEDMVSVESGRSYRDLPAAFQYRTAAEFQSCDHQRYHRRVAELRARTVTPGNLANAVIPLPTFRPDGYPALAENSVRHASIAAAELPPEGVSMEQTSSIRNVRIVLPSRVLSADLMDSGADPD
jgi:hypothetical protein